MAFFSAAQIEMLAATTVRLDLLVEMQFASGTRYVWNGNTALETGGNVYQPMRGLGGIDGLDFAGEAVSEKVTLTLSGLPADLTAPDGGGFLGFVLGETADVDQRIVKISVQFFDADWQPVGAPAPIWWGYMQPPRVSRTPMTETEGGVQSITVTAENAFFNRSRPPFGRYTDRDQQSRSPGDLFFQFAPGLVNKTVTYPDY